MSSRTASSCPTTGARSCSVGVCGYVSRTCCSPPTSPARSASRRQARGMSLRGMFIAEARIMLRMGLVLAAILVPVQIFFGHLTGDYVHDKQPAKFAAIEARWHDEQPASEVLIALPDPDAETNRYAISIPVLGQRDRQHEPRFQGGRADRLSCRRAAAGADPVLHLPDHGRLRSHHAAARLARILSQHQGAHRAQPTAALGNLSQLPVAVHRDPDRLVHGRGRAPALDGLWRCYAQPTR